MDFTEVVSNTDHISEIKQLWNEYVNSLGFNPEYLSKDLMNAPKPYNPPTGYLLLASIQGQVVGCIALKKGKENTAEIVRLYVRPSFRGKGIGKALVYKVIKKAKKFNYQFLLLETAPSLMKEAFCLYDSIGFQKTSSHYDSRISANVVCMQLHLT